MNQQSEHEGPFDDIKGNYSVLHFLIKITKTKLQVQHPSISLRHDEKE